MAPDRRPYAALRHPDFRRFAGGMFVSLLGSQMQNTAIDWHVWVLTGSPLALGAVGLARFAPIVALSLAGGFAADRYDRRRILLATQCVMCRSARAPGRPYQWSGRNRPPRRSRRGSGSSSGPH